MLKLHFSVNFGFRKLKSLSLKMMNQNSVQQVFPVFLVIWALLGGSGAAFFFFNRNAALKRKVLPFFVVLAGLLFLGFIFYTDASTESLYLAVPMVTLITFLNIRTIRFCDACGRTERSQSPFSLPKFCSKCGAAMKQ
ncbi:hypothetical protein LPB67_11350 [Undibacterium sp. Jales W-56]|uniref:hypothetical protein n=1 Tax=Undibacterium sp. Jales W-56 TaxID=2897325 RepID=UPI0021D3AA44|nr:hypothetical protein [Undibacterium sp. Jales W-56]MCU6434368.1 hypothetical protein [Undibacterium sp. Jales W-56]